MRSVYHFIDGGGAAVRLELSVRHIAHGKTRRELKASAKGKGE
jgi:hypothetical protein